LVPIDESGLDTTLPPDDIVLPEITNNPTTTKSSQKGSPQFKTTSVKIAAVTKGPSMATTTKQLYTTTPVNIKATLNRNQTNYPAIPAVYSTYQIYDFPNLKSKPSDGVFSVEDDGSPYEMPFIASFKDGTWIVVSSLQTNTESFGRETLLEGAEVIFSGKDPCPDVKSPITPVAQPAAIKDGSNKITCAPSGNRAFIATTKAPVTESSAGNNKNSILYVSDCVGYPVSSAFFKNNNLIITLDTNDDSILYSGYYKLVL